MTEAETNDDDEHPDDALEARRDADHLRLVCLLLLIYAPFALVPLFDGAGEPLARRTGYGLGHFLAFVGYAAACASPLVAAFLISQRRLRTVAVALAFVSAWNWPAGTVAGVAALLVLARPSVAELFEDAAASRRISDADHEQRRASLRRLRAARRAARRGDDVIG